MKCGFALLIGFHVKVMSLIHVDDLIEAMMLAGESASAVGRTYFLGSEGYYTIRELGSSIARSGPAPVESTSPRLRGVLGIGAAATAMGRLNGAQVFFKLNKAREAVQPAWTCLVERAKAELGFRQYVSLDDGMRSTCTWYCHRLWM